MIGRGVIVATLAAGLALAGPASAANDPLRGEQPNLSMVESDAAHATATGAGAIVAIVDTGVQASHPDLQGGRLLPGHDFVDDDGVPEDSVDGHGTHVLGIVGAAENNGVGIASVAPGARLLPVRVLDNSGAGLVEDVARGIDYAVAQGAHVINLSLGSDVPLVGAIGGDEYDDAIRRALRAGRVVVAASGNNSAPACEQPSASEGLLCVGSVNDNGIKSSFSSFGPGLAITAPGNNVLSTFNDGGYKRISGTSQASPHVAGVAALLVGKGLRGQAVADRILATATDAGPDGPDYLYGAGIVNARRAVAGLPGGGSRGTSSSSRAGSAARISLRSRDRIRRVLKRGIRVRCRAAGSGRCRVRVTRRAKTLAYGSRRVTVGRSVVAVARPNRRGRLLLRRALRRGKSVRLRVKVTLPGARPFVRRLTLRP